jgi:hypothetical protein
MVNCYPIFLAFVRYDMTPHIEDAKRRTILFALSKVSSKLSRFRVNSESSGIHDIDHWNEIIILINLFE